MHIVGDTYFFDGKKLDEFLHVVTESPQKGFSALLKPENYKENGLRTLERFRLLPIGSSDLVQISAKEFFLNGNRKDRSSLPEKISANLIDVPLTNQKFDLQDANTATHIQISRLMRAVTENGNKALISTDSYSVCVADWGLMISDKRQAITDALIKNGKKLPVRDFGAGATLTMFLKEYFVHAEKQEAIEREIARPRSTALKPDTGGGLKSGLSNTVMKSKTVSSTSIATEIMEKSGDHTMKPKIKFFNPDKASVKRQVPPPVNEITNPTFVPVSEFPEPEEKQVAHKPDAGAKTYRHDIPHVAKTVEDTHHKSQRISRAEMLLASAILLSHQGSFTSGQLMSHAFSKINGGLMNVAKELYDEGYLTRENTDGPKGHKLYYTLVNLPQNMTEKRFDEIVPLLESSKNGQVNHIATSNNLTPSEGPGFSQEEKKISPEPDVIIKSDVVADNYEEPQDYAGFDQIKIQFPENLPVSERNLNKRQVENMASNLDVTMSAAIILGQKGPFSAADLARFVTGKLDFNYSGMTKKIADEGFLRINKNGRNNEFFAEQLPKDLTFEKFQLSLKKIKGLQEQATTEIDADFNPADVSSEEIAEIKAQDIFALKNNEVQEAQASMEVVIISELPAVTVDEDRNIVPVTEHDTDALSDNTEPDETPVSNAGIAEALSGLGRVKQSRTEQKIAQISPESVLADQQPVSSDLEPEIVHEQIKSELPAVSIVPVLKPSVPVISATTSSDRAFSENPFSYTLNDNVYYPVQPNDAQVVPLLSLANESGAGRYCTIQNETFDRFQMGSLIMPASGKMTNISFNGIDAEMRIIRFDNYSLGSTIPPHVIFIEPKTPNENPDADIKSVYTALKDEVLQNGRYNDCLSNQVVLSAFEQQRQKAALFAQGQERLFNAITPLIADLRPLVS